MQNLTTLLSKFRTARPALQCAVVALFATAVSACSDDSKATSTGSNTGGAASLGGSSGAGGEPSATGGSGGASSNYKIGSDVGGSGFNQCGVAAPLPKSTGQCIAVTVPVITNFDDYTGSSASSYSYKVNANTANSVLGTILHIDDGSASGDAGTSVVTTQMVTGEGNAGYALQFSDTNAAKWGGLLMFFFPNAGVCLDASGFQGLEFSIKGSSSSGRFGVNIGMLDTVATKDGGLCSNAADTDCKDANLELLMPADATAWKQVQIPWSAFTPGIGSDLSCVPVTGANILRLVIQPFMNYPPPNYTYQPGPYNITVDNLKFY